jgi:hypothetical protein
MTHTVSWRIAVCTVLMAAGMAGCASRIGRRCQTRYAGLLRVAYGPPTPAEPIMKFHFKDGPQWWHLPQDFPTAPTDNITRRLCVGRITEATPGE